MSLSSACFRPSTRAHGTLWTVIDIWVPMKKAREVADSLGRLEELAAFLDWQTRRAWSVEDKEEGGLVHKCAELVSAHRGHRG